MYALVDIVKDFEYELTSRVVSWPMPDPSVLEMETLSKNADLNNVKDIQYYESIREIENRYFNYYIPKYAVAVHGWCYVRKQMTGEMYHLVKSGIAIDRKAKILIDIDALSVAENPNLTILLREIHLKNILMD